MGSDQDTYALTQPPVPTRTAAFVVSGAAMRATVDEIDAELRVIRQRRDAHQDDLMRLLAAIDACADRTEVLLQRRSEASK